MKIGSTTISDLKVGSQSVKKVYLGSQVVWMPADFHPTDVGVYAMYDTQDLSTLWQDTAGTVPATVGSTVARRDDISGNGRHQLQSTAGIRPTLEQDANGGYYLSGTGGKTLTVTWTAPIPTPFTTFAAANLSSTLRQQPVVSPAAFTGSGVMEYDPERTNERSLAFNGTVLFQDDIGILDDTVVLSVVFDGATSVSRANQIEVTGDTGTRELTGSAQDRNSLRIADYGVVHMNRRATAQEIRDIETWMENRAKSWMGRNNARIIDSGSIRFGPRRNSYSRSGAIFIGGARFNAESIVTKRTATTSETAVLRTSAVRNDHNNPSLIPALDGRVIASLVDHGGSTIRIYRSTSVDSLDFTEIATITNRTEVYYPDLFRMPNDDLWLVLNDGDEIWHYVSTNDGATWDTGTLISSIPSVSGGLRTYSDYSMVDGELLFAIKNGNGDTFAPSAGLSLGSFKYAGGSWQKLDGTSITLPLTAMADTDIIFASPSPGSATRFPGFQNVIQKDSLGRYYVIHTIIESGVDNDMNIAVYDAGSWSTSFVAKTASAAVPLTGVQEYDAMLIKVDGGGDNYINRITSTDRGATWSETLLVEGVFQFPWENPNYPVRGDGAGVLVQALIRSTHENHTLELQNVPVMT